SSPSSAPYSYLHSFPTRRSSDLIANGLLVLLCPDLAPIDIQPLRIDTLPGEVADQPPNSNLKLLLDERFRDLEFVIVFKPFQKRSEEHTSELQSRFDLVCRLLLE